MKVKILVKIFKLNFTIRFYFIHFSRLNSISIILFWENTGSASKNYQNFESFSGALVKTIQYSKFRIIPVIPVCNLTLHLTLPYHKSYLTIPYVLPHLTLPYVLPYLTLPYLTIPYLIMSYLTPYLTIPYILPYLPSLTLPFILPYLTLCLTLPYILPYLS